MARKGDGGTLRQCEDVSFLGTPPLKTSRATSTLAGYYLCDAHVFCVVWGTSILRWEADMFLDTFFDSEDHIVEHQGGPHDPLRPGKPADRPILEPRLYFLDMFAGQIERVKAEWGEVLIRLSHAIKESVSLSFVFSNSTEVHSSRTEGGSNPMAHDHFIPLL